MCVWSAKRWWLVSKLNVFTLNVFDQVSLFSLRLSILRNYINTNEKLTHSPYVGSDTWAMLLGPAFNSCELRSIILSCNSVRAMYWPCLIWKHTNWIELSTYKIHNWHQICRCRHRHGRRVTNTFFSRSPPIFFFGIWNKTLIILQRNRELAILMGLF